MIKFCYFFWSCKFGMYFKMFEGWEFDFWGCLFVSGWLISVYNLFIDWLDYSFILLIRNN